MIIVNHERLAEMVTNCYNQKNESNMKKIPLLVYGTFGIGKSYTIEEKAKEIAGSKNKEFFNWNELSEDKKEDIAKNPKGKFIFIDKRLSENDPSDIKGLPDFQKDYVVWKSELWSQLLTNPESDGILFFDEIGNAEEMVRVSCYKIIYDRVIGERKISDDWLIIGASNLETDKAGVNEIQIPLRDRACEVQLVPPNKDEWITNFAYKHNIDRRIIAYINWKGATCLYNFDSKSHQKPTSPRGWERVNTLIRGIDDMKKLELIIFSSIGESVAGDFLAFLKLKDSFDVKAIIENPQLLANISNDANGLGKRFFITSVFVDHYVEGKIDFKKVMEVSKVFDDIHLPEFVKLLWGMCMNINAKKWNDDFMNKDRNNPLKDKYHKYFV